LTGQGTSSNCNNGKVVAETAPDGLQHGRCIIT
jgi:hypothetical protein